MRRSGIAIAVLATTPLLVTACVGNSQVANDSDPVGCWYFERDAAATALALPWGVRLTGDAVTGWPIAERGARVAATLTPDGDAGHPFGYWLELPGDSLEIGYPAGGGITLRVAREAAALSGIARPVGDVITPGAPPRSDHPVRLTRAACPGA
jgi:hypothetical protein